MAMVTARIDDELKKEASEIYNELGMDTATAIRLFFKQTVITRSIPFELSLDNKDVEEAKRYISTYAEKNARKLDMSNPEDVAFLFDEDEE